MSAALERAQIKVIARSVSGVGAIHDYERYEANPDVLKSWAVRRGRVDLWMIRTHPMKPTRLTCGEQERHTLFILSGWKSVVDAVASRKTTENLCQTLLDTFIAERTLNGTATDCDEPDADPVRRALFQIGEGKYLCDNITIRIVAHERAAVTYS